MTDSFEFVFKRINGKLNELNIDLLEERCRKEFNDVHYGWRYYIKNNFQDVKLSYLIIGEATQNWDNFIYNPNSKGTSFLSPKHFDCADKDELLSKFKENKIGIFDLNLLPLPSFIYRNITVSDIDKGTKEEYRKVLEQYYNSCIGVRGMNTSMIDDKTKIVIRYKKLEKSFEWEVFKAFCEKKYGINQIYSIHGEKGNMQADLKKIKSIFFSN